MEVRRWRDYNWPLLGCVAVLLIIGLLALHSATLTAVTFNGVPLRTIFPRQIVYIIVGLVLMLGATLLDYRLLSSLSRPIYIVVVALLAVVLLIGRVSEGAQSWIALGERTFQPSEAGKLALMLALGAYWSRHEGQTDHWLVQLGSLFILLPPMVLVLIQPDLGSAIVYATIWLVMAWGAGMRWSQLLILSILALPLGLVAWEHVLDEYQHVRLMTFYYLLTDMSKVDPDAGYNVIQALSAISSGGWVGTGLTRGLFSQGNYVPVQHTDFIFAVVGEELGFVGGLVLIIFEALLLWQALTIAEQSSNLFGRQLALGVFAMIFAHVLINIGMNLSLLPVTGLPLPFVSAGGSFMITVLVGVGLLQSIALRRKRLAF
ncbi:cell cycle protein [Oscillochloris trichoides DG-6]|uniref:Cell cycle protein n=1 Tax=Oscillochloris trichoides DG-6 TaxID=765420 RepID=E1IHK4_9CHLR|nr:FtsW/RodA/SpoVE family cell cycle protein [Oscillochloris trichoides]EFO79367.1 cell cycle protein [Oscillochloris trichoides DG-6]